MTSNNIVMKDIFSKLSEKNKDVIILIAKSLKNIQKRMYNLIMLQHKSLN